MVPAGRSRVTKTNEKPRSRGAPLVNSIPDRVRGGLPHVASSWRGASWPSRAPRGRGAMEDLRSVPRLSWIMSFSVYVIKVDDGENKKAVYVGETGKSIQERFEEHRDGYNSNLKRKDIRPLRVMRDECITGIETRDEARRMERKVAEDFRQRGWEVYGGH
jgi:hypothetical protein